MTKIKPRLIARISCQECRRRKTRCNFDGQSQKCSTCARIGTPCIFSQKNGVILDMDKVMEENNPHLVHQREKEQRAKERARLASSSSTSTSTTSAATIVGGLPLAPASDMSLYSKSTPASSFLSDGSHFANRSSRSNSLSSAAQLGRSSSTEDLSSVMDRLQIDAYGIAPHTLRSFSQVAGDNDSAETSADESSGVDESVDRRDLMDASDDIKPIPILNKRNSSGSNTASNANRQGRHRSSRSRSVPAVDIQPDLIDLYFKHVHPFLLVLHKPSFFRRLHDPKDPVPDFLLAAMYAVASHYAPGREEDGRRYFQFWLSRLDDTLDKPRLSTIQALLMVIKYQEGVKHTGFYFRTYMYTQMVVVLARELQLHKTTPVNAKLDPENHEVRRRLFWAIFVLDQFMSVSQGRTMSFREVEPEADLPRIDTENPNDPEEIEVIQNAIEYIKLVKIDHQALILARKFLTKVVTPEETIPQGLFLHQAMLAWKANLPPRLQLASNMSPHTPFVAMLHILYHACAIMVQRCYCEDPSVSHLEIAAVSRETCTVSATNITVIIDDLYTNHGMLPLTYPIRGSYFIIYCLIAAATIQANDVRRGTNGPIMFKRSLALLNIILRKSTAVDIEKEVELLKSSLDTPMEGRLSGSASAGTLSSSNSHHYDHRPPLKPILPMSQKYGSRMSFGTSSVTPMRIRKISPKGATPASSSSNIAQSKTSLSSIGSTAPSLSAGSTIARSMTESSASPQSQQLDDDLDLKIKSSPSPDMASRSISSGLSSTDDLPAASPDTFLRSVPMFTAPASLPSDFNAFAQAQMQALGGNGKQDAPPLLSVAQFLVSQQEQLRLQQQKLQQSSLGSLTAAQFQEQHRIQQQQFMQSQQQQQQQQDPALMNTFLNSISSLNNYQQLNSDQAQNELLSMLDSTMFNYDDNTSTFSLGNAYSQQQQQQRQQQPQQDGLNVTLSPSSTIMSSAFSPERNQHSLFDSLMSNDASLKLPEQKQQQQRQRSASTDESLTADEALARDHLQDTPSPDSNVPMMDMSSSFPVYIGVDSAVPFGIRQALGDADKIFKFQADIQE
ncbi:hypothetical protein BGX28_002802 [Mortierella sp. GBA30]|nr:hypothetical protein BGX28_002802 [Mortierella sp. GBA30]